MYGEARTSGRGENVHGNMFSSSLSPSSPVTCDSVSQLPTMLSHDRVN